MVFQNMSKLLTKSEWVDKVMKIVADLLKDDRVEVREKAGVILGGLLHCEFIQAERKKALLVSNLAPS